MATYNAGNSDGQPLEIIGTQNVVVTNEALNKVAAQIGETVVYTATVKDGQGLGLPANFVADLEINGTKLIEGQAFDSSVYGPSTYLLTLSFVVPALLGSHMVRLAWSEQTI